MNHPPPLLLEPALLPYAWGDPRFIPELLGIDAGSAPCAEAWYGAHPHAPARVVRATGANESLDAVLSAAGRAYAGSTRDPGDHRLPYLLKLLAAARPLSVQVHPDRQQALAGFAREEAAGLDRRDPARGYRDAHHKPELLVALTPFHALCGFRDADELPAVVAGLPELAALLPAFTPDPAGLKAMLRAYFALPADQVAGALSALLRRLAEEDARAPFAASDARHWALQAHRLLATGHPPDRGLLFVFLLNLIELRPGQAVFVPPGVPHAYLAGAALELMTNSDNVLRAGLTTKPVDPADVLRVLRYDSGPVPILEPIADESGAEDRYAVPAAELELRAIRLPAGGAVAREAYGPETVLALAEAPGTRVRVVTAAGTCEVGRGRACLLAHGTRYTLETDAPARVFVAGVPAPVRVRTYRGRRPSALAFGTSGLRGLVTDITDLEAYVNTRGFLDFLVSDGRAAPGAAVAIGGDLRPSTDGDERSILRAVARAITDAGFRVRHCGRLPVPALAYYGLRHGIAGVMVTGSHIPFDRNGIKLYTPTGEVLKTDEAAILAAVERVRAREYERARAGSPFDDAGFFVPGARPALPDPTDDAARLYEARYTDAFPAGALTGLRVALFEHSAVGRDLLARILRGLGAEVHPVGRSATFVPLDTEAVSAERLAEIAALAGDLRRRVGPIDAVVSTDGDGDRPLLLAFDRADRLHAFGGDLLGTVVADYLDADAIAVPVSASDVVERHFAGRGVRVARTRIGSPWVLAAIERMPGARRVGWESNGGFLLGSSITLASGGRLEPLPTRDAVLPLVVALHAARRSHAALPDLFERLPRRVSRAGLLDGVPPEQGRLILSEFGLDGSGVRAVRFGPDGIVVTDEDGRERRAGGEEYERFAELRSRLSRHVGPGQGFAPLAELDALDGLRMGFADGAVAHVRPSGNAPQLRIYALADDAARADAIVADAVREPDGLLRGLLAAAARHHFVAAVRRNVETAGELRSRGEAAPVIGVVSGSAAAQAFWQGALRRVAPALGARAVVSLHEDLPVNQAFGLLLLWQRVRATLGSGDGGLFAFAFGEGSRAAPITEAECGQKPAITSFVASPVAGRRLSILELALWSFAPVEAYLRRSGFSGVVVKWGDEIQIPTRDLRGADPLFAGADVVRFVSLQPVTADSAANKDWVGVDANSRVTGFIPRRRLEQMEPLADRGVLQRRDGRLFGGINLGSIALSRELLDLLLEEFAPEVNDAAADRARRPDLDPQFFTALTIAVIDDTVRRTDAWRQARAESPAIERLAEQLPAVLVRLRTVVERFRQRHGRDPKLVALDFGDQYWGDIGQHGQMYDFFHALAERGAHGQIARALAGLPDVPDARGNIIAGDSELGPDVTVRDSVLIDVHIDSGTVEECVLIGTRAERVVGQRAFDVESTVRALHLGPRAGAYKIVSGRPVSLAAGERATTVFTDDAEHLMRVAEATDLRDRARSYEAPILGNALSFAALRARVLAADPARIEERRAQARERVMRLLGNADPPE